MIVSSMKNFITVVLTSILFPACGPGLNELDEKKQTINLSYVTWACDCANWATPEDIEKYNDNNGDSLAHLSIFIEPADSSLTLPDTLGYSGDLIRFTGRFYKKKGFPKGYESIEHPDKARVFRYTAYKVIYSNYRQFKEIDD